MRSAAHHRSRRRTTAPRWRRWSAAEAGWFAPAPSRGASGGVLFLDEAGEFSGIRSRCPASSARDRSRSRSTAPGCPRRSRHGSSWSWRRTRVRAAITACRADRACARRRRSAATSGGFRALCWIASTSGSGSCACRVFRPSPRPTRSRPRKLGSGSRQARDRAQRRLAVALRGDERASSGAVVAPGTACSRSGAAPPARHSAATGSADAARLRPYAPRRVDPGGSRWARPTGDRGHRAGAVPAEGGCSVSAELPDRVDDRRAQLEGTALAESEGRRCRGCLGAGGLESHHRTRRRRRRATWSRRSVPRRRLREIRVATRLLAGDARFGCARDGSQALVAAAEWHRRGRACSGRPARPACVLLTPDDAEWPRGLADLGAHAPLVLWVRGAGDASVVAAAACRSRRRARIQRLRRAGRGRSGR